MLKPSSGTPFHSLQATSHALQPMHTLVSVKNPLRAGGSSYPASAAGSIGPKRLFFFSTSAAPLGFDRPDSVVIGEPGAVLVARHQVEQLLAVRPATGAHVAGAHLALLDEHVGVERDAHQVVGGVTGD